MKNIVSLILMVLSIAGLPSMARAGKWEISAGVTHAHKVSDGTYYQTPLPHHLTLTLPSIGVDYRSKYWMIGYKWLGRFAFSSIIVPDSQYNAASKTANTSKGVEHWHGVGTVQGIYVAGSIHPTSNVTIDAGPWFYLPKMDVYTPDIIVGNQRGKEHWWTHKPNIGFMADIQVMRGNLGIRASVFEAKTKYLPGNCVPGIYNGLVSNMSLVWALK